MSVHRPFKATERALAKRFGGQRMGHLGGVDVSAGWLAIEAKHRKSLPTWLTGAIAQARRNAQDGQLGIVVLHQHGTRHNDDVVVLRLSDFEQWFGETLTHVE